MKLVMCSIRDVKVEGFHSPMFFQSRAQAVRSFGDAVNGGQGDFAKHPEDFQLFAIGEFDDADGSVICYPPEFLALGANLFHDRSQLSLIKEG